MKSKIFKNAWKMVKEFGVTFPSALTIAWSEFKISLLEIKYKSISVFEWKKQLQVRSLINNLVDKKNSIKPCNIEYKFNNKINNDGAKYWYGIGVYNGD